MIYRLDDKNNLFAGDRIDYQVIKSDKSSMPGVKNYAESAVSIDEINDRVIRKLHFHFLCLILEKVKNTKK